LLRADAAYAVFEHAFGEHALAGANIAQQAFHEDAVVVHGRPLTDFLGAHIAPKVRARTPGDQ